MSDTTGRGIPSPRRHAGARLARVPGIVVSVGIAARDWSGRVGGIAGRRLGVKGFLVLAFLAAWSGNMAEWHVLDGPDGILNVPNEEEQTEGSGLSARLLVAVDELASALDAAPTGKVPAFRVAYPRTGSPGHGTGTSVVSLDVGTGFAMLPSGISIEKADAGKIDFSMPGTSWACAYMLTQNFGHALEGRVSFIADDHGTDEGVPVPLGLDAASKACAAKAKAGWEGGRRFRMRYVVSRAMAPAR